MAVRKKAAKKKPSSTVTKQCAKLRRLLDVTQRYWHSMGDEGFTSSDAIGQAHDLVQKLKRSGKKCSSTTMASFKKWDAAAFKRWA